MNLGVQYYRPPFPDKKYWSDDFSRIRDAGLNTVQFWVLWAWVEPQPGKFIFDDYDRLFELAEQNNLGVILSSIAEIQPYWIHHQVPGSEMVDHMGRKVVSSNRVECHFGLTPGGCTDVPGVWQGMTNYFTQLVTRYRSSANLRGWDAWNELRWNVQADGLVCFCPDTLREFRAWLDQKYGGLDGLNAAWKRRYGGFEEVLPGKLPGRPYTEMMAFEHFLTARANRHAKNRYELIKSLDPSHPVTVHGAEPCVFSGGWAQDHALNRGNDWRYADDLDGIGCSSFPKWFGIDDADYAIRVGCVKSAARDKQVWLSEIQGGRAAQGFSIHLPVDASSQQKWIWNGIAGGAKTILFWCWRDEVFGCESGGYGVIGRDGLAEERLTAMKITGERIKTYRDLIDHYEPDRPQVGILFSPQSYYLYWAQEATAERAVNGLLGYARGLVRRSIPFTLVEENHLDNLEELKILFLPRAVALTGLIQTALEKYIRTGGTIVCESECGAYDEQGLYHYPEDRFLARLTGWVEIGRRTLEADAVELNFNNLKFKLPAAQWLTPLHRDSQTTLLATAKLGAGRIILLGGYFGDAYRCRNTMEFEDLTQQLVLNAGWQPSLEIISPKPTADSFVYLQHGQSGGKKVLFVFFPADCDEVSLKLKNSGRFYREIFSDCRIDATYGDQFSKISIPAAPWRLSVLVEE